MFKVITIPVTAIEQNARIFVHEESKTCIVFDAGGNSEKLFEVIEKKNLKPLAILLTHSHFDHCGGVKSFLEKYNVPLYAHSIEESFRGRVEEILKMYGITDFSMSNCPEPTSKEYYLDNIENLTIGNFTFKVLFTPGHAPGHVCFYHVESKNLFAGDTLFKLSIGRTDLPFGNHETLINSIKSKIFTLPTDTKILPGHGDDTNLDFEIKNNPYLKS